MGLISDSAVSEYVEPLPAVVMLFAIIDHLPSAESGTDRVGTCGRNVSSNRTVMMMLRSGGLHGSCSAEDRFLSRVITSFRAKA